MLVIIGSTRLQWSVLMNRMQDEIYVYLKMNATFEVRGFQGGSRNRTDGKKLSGRIARDKKRMANRRQDWRRKLVEDRVRYGK